MRITAIKILGLVLLVSVFVFLPGQKAHAWGPPSCFDFVTVGGFYFGSNESPGGRVNFGGNAGYKNDSQVPLMAHINVEDHDSGRHIKIDNASNYEVPSADCHCRDFHGWAEVTLPGKASYTTIYDVRVCDYGEPGNTSAGATKPDIFAIFLGDGYRAGVPNSNLVGGNAQIHKNCQPSCP